MTSDDAVERPVTVKLPEGLPMLTSSASRILLEILVELTDPDRPTEGDEHGG